ncbi:MAG: DUF2059 domain-containing protein [Rhodobacteraceae bacterium]|nr:DUF2059 domain-containing protein [Paracoccaceae bacterium]
MKPQFLAAAIALFTVPAFAQDTNELAIQYVELPAVQNMMTEMFSPTSMGNQMAASFPAGLNLSDEKILQIGEVMSQAMSDIRPAMETQMILGSAEFFSVDELQALIDFYSSEAGASILLKMTPFMAHVLGELQPQMQAMQLRVQPEIIAIVQE